MHFFICKIGMVKNSKVQCPPLRIPRWFGRVYAFKMLKQWLVCSKHTINMNYCNFMSYPLIEHVLRSGNNVLCFTLIIEVNSQTPVRKLVPLSKEKQRFGDVMGQWKQNSKPSCLIPDPTTSMLWVSWGKKLTRHDSILHELAQSLSILGAQKCLLNKLPNGHFCPEFTVKWTKVQTNFKTCPIIPQMGDLGLKLRSVVIKAVDYCHHRNNFDFTYWERWKQVKKTS